MAWDSDGLRDITQDAYRLAATGSLLANTGGGGCSRHSACETSFRFQGLYCVVTAVECARSGEQCTAWLRASQHKGVSAFL